MTENKTIVYVVRTKADSYGNYCDFGHRSSFSKARTLANHVRSDPAYSSMLGSDAIYIEIREKVETRTLCDLSGFAVGND